MADEYNDAVDGLEAPPTETDPENNSFFVSKDALGGKECKPGDTLSMKVVSVDEETGEVELAAAGYDKEPATETDSMEEDLRQSLA